MVLPPPVFSANPQYNILEVKKRTIQTGGGYLLQSKVIPPETVWKFSLKWTKAFSHSGPHQDVKKRETDPSSRSCFFTPW